MLALQGKHVPELHAYSPSIFILMDWIDGMNLLQYKEANGTIPPALLYDMYTTELQQIRDSLKDWEIELKSKKPFWTS